MRKSYLLRIDPDLWSDLEVWARDDLRSVNAQIEYLLRQAVVKRKGNKATPPAVTDQEKDPRAQE